MMLHHHPAARCLQPKLNCGSEQSTSEPVCFVSAWQWQWVRKMVIRVIFHFWLAGPLVVPISWLTTLRKTRLLHIDSK